MTIFFESVPGTHCGRAMQIWKATVILVPLSIDTMPPPHFFWSSGTFSNGSTTYLQSSATCGYGNRVTVSGYGILITVLRTTVTKITVELDYGIPITVPKAYGKAEEGGGERE